LKVFVLGLDALELELVKKYRCGNLMQSEYGRVKINVHPEVTPTIWASFLTGKRPKEHGIIGWEWENSILDKFKLLFHKLRLKNLTKPLKVWIGIGKVLEFLGCELSLKELTIPTIFDLCNPSISVNVPCLGYKTTVEVFNRKIVSSIGNKEIARIVLAEAYGKFERVKETALDQIEEDWGLFMAYFYIGDFVQHVKFYDERAKRELYKKLDRTAKVFKETVDDNTLFLIVSDHGMRRGVHTDYGFYSLNKKMNLNNPKVTDFYDLIRGWLNA